jgi:UDP-N-acetylglucosamine--N-acetylmuramyl-(pentapeptide) pyrophosphoryl-undecaprenol N-acetylglucosamine transferase
VYPALAVLQALNDLDPSWQADGALLWLGGEEGMEGELISRLNIAFRGIPAAGVHGVGRKSLPGNLIKLFRGTIKSRRIIREFNPDVLFFTGGYLAVPVAVAGLFKPSLVFVPDIEPGLAIKAISNLVTRIALSVEESRKYAPGRKQVIVSGYPVRKELTAWSREKALKELNLSNQQPILLVIGGSRGARSINRALAEILPRLLEEIQVIHISGSLDWDEVRDLRLDLPESLRENYHVYPFLHEEMGAALKSADLVISRSGASILGEYPEFELPSILVPYPYAWRYQKTNAGYLADRGAAVVISDEDLETELLATVLDLIQDRNKLESMKSSLRELAGEDAAVRLANELKDLAGTTSGGDAQ